MKVVQSINAWPTNDEAMAFAQLISKTQSMDTKAYLFNTIATIQTFCMPNRVNTRKGCSSTQSTHLEATTVTTVAETFQDLLKTLVYSRDHGDTHTANL